MNKIRNWGAATFATVAASSAFAQAAENPIVTLVNTVGIAGVAAAVLVLMTGVVAIAMTMKGGTVAKRVVAKI